MTIDKIDAKKLIISTYVMKQALQRDLDVVDNPLTKTAIEELIAEYDVLRKKLLTYSESENKKVL